MPKNLTDSSAIAHSRARRRSGGVRRVALLLAIAFSSGVRAAAPAAGGSAGAGEEPTPQLRFDVDAAIAASTWVPTRLRVGEVSAPAKLRRSGAPPLPGTRDKRSLEVRLTGEQRLFGMRRFSLRGPATAGFQSQSLVFDHLRREGLLAPRTFFVAVSLNGADIGLMLLEEDLSKELLESQQRREGVIFRFEEGSFPLARVQPFGAKKIAKSKRRSAELRAAAGLLSGFLHGKLGARDVFDVELMGRFLAIAEVWDSIDLLRWQNLRFYFNPVTQRLEPVGREGRFATGSAGTVPAATAEPWPSRLLDDPGLRSAFLRNRRRIAAEMADGTLPARAAAVEIPLLRLLRREHPALAPADLEPLRARARSLSGASAADPARADAEPSLREARGAAALRAPPEVPALRANPIPSASLDEVLARHTYLEWDEARHTLRASRGSWTVPGSLVLPEGVGLALSEGTALRFGAGEMLLACGPLRFRGSEANPVVLEGIPAATGRGSWQGIVVLRSDEPHEWDHVIVRDTSGIDRDGWKLTGGVTLRASEVAISHGSFRGNRAEDALNLIRSRFSLSDVSIRDTASDALDVDFSEGSVSGGRFSDVGGDAIDVSGSTLALEGARFVAIHDKAISIGESSRLVARGVRIRQAGTGVVGKDGSEVIFEDSEVSDVEHVAIMAYIKKAEYGPARVSARNIALRRVGRPAVAQHGSHISIDGVEQISESLDVEALYERGYMKK